MFAPLFGPDETNKLSDLARLFPRPKIGGLGPEVPKHVWYRVPLWQTQRGATGGPLTRPRPGWALRSNAVQRLRRALTCAMTFDCDWLLMRSLG